MAKAQEDDEAARAETLRKALEAADNRRAERIIQAARDVVAAREAREKESGK